MNKKQKQIVDTAQELFFRFGLNKVTIEEVCKKSGVSKMTFYKYYKNKNELIEYILMRLVEEGKEAYTKIMQSDMVFEEKIQAVVDMKVGLTQKVSQEFIQEIYSREDTNIPKVFEEAIQDSYRSFRNDLEKAKADGQLRADVNIDLVMYWLKAMRKMLEDKQVIGLFSSSEDLTKELNKMFFYGIMPSAENNK